MKNWNYQPKQKDSPELLEYIQYCKTQQHYRNQQPNFYGYNLGKPSTGKPNSREKEFPEWVIIPIAIAGFLGFYYAGVFAEWLINLQTILK